MHICTGKWIMLITDYNYLFSGLYAVIKSNKDLGALYINRCKKVSEYTLYVLAEHAEARHLRSGKRFMLASDLQTGL